MVFYDEMSKIISRVPLTEELLNILYEYHYGDSKKESLKDAKKLIREYIRKKNN